ILIFIYGVITKRKELNGIEERFMVVSGILSLFLLIMTASEFPWDIITDVDNIKKITGILQFSFRFMMIAAPLLTMAAVYFLYEFNLEQSKGRILVVAVVIIALLSISPGILGEMKEQPYMSQLSGGTSKTILKEYWPNGVTDGIFNDNSLFWSSENLVFEGYNKDGLRVEFDYVTLSDENEALQPPVLYYPGYRAVAITPTGEKYDLGVSQGDYFRAKIDLPAALSGSHVKFYYGGLWYFYIAYAISIISAIAFTAFYIWHYRAKLKSIFKWKDETATQ
ncbi:MAG: hypothetical protein K6G03_07325, partial [Lachnospiraceae bacterium]|nr:hypothetical protein [Lachnospiraceae bacterium]